MLYTCRIVPSSSKMAKAVYAARPLLMIPTPRSLLLLLLLTFTPFLDISERQTTNGPSLTCARYRTIPRGLAEGVCPHTMGKRASAAIVRI